MQLWPSKHAKMRSGRGSAPKPAGGAPPDSLVGWEWTTLPINQSFGAMVPRFPRLQRLDLVGALPQIFGCGIAPNIWCGGIAHEYLVGALPQIFGTGALHRNIWWGHCPQIFGPEALPTNIWCGGIAPNIGGGIAHKHLVRGHCPKYLVGHCQQIFSGHCLQIFGGALPTNIWWGNCPKYFSQELRLEAGVIK